MEKSDLKPCPRCGCIELRRYHKRSDCVKCTLCGYFNLEENWNDGMSDRGWDHIMIQHVRILERLLMSEESCNVISSAIVLTKLYETPQEKQDALHEQRLADAKQDLFRDVNAYLEKEGTDE